MLGGTGVGLAAGLGLAPLLAREDTSRVLASAAVGTGLGVSESLLFAWSGRASGDQFGGAALFGGGLGAALGVAAAATPASDRGSAPVTAGFAAWGAFSGSLAGSLLGYDPHEILFGGLIGANAGTLTGYGLLRSGLVDANDFGWLSLFGALGTVAGAGVGAPFAGSTSAPIRAGLAVGPAAGMVVGALVLPRLRRALAPTQPTSTALALDDPDDDSSPAPPAPSARGLSHPRKSPAVDDSSSLSRRLSQVGSVTDWQPLVGALPVSQDGAPAPVLFGVTGHWK
jgi:hypothetical protein